ncbi:MAG: hypothetical protein ABIC04_00180 [Nanoarchaeota archaeon]
MFNLFKKFFRNEEPAIQNLELNDLKPFFNEKSKEFTKDLNTKILEIKHSISLEVSKTKSNLEILRNAELRNKNVPVKALQFLDGNKESYIKLVNALLDQIIIENEYDKIQSFCTDFSDKLAQLAKSSGKAYHVLQEFLANESRDIALNIKNLDNMVKNLKKMVDDPILDKIKQLKENILSIKRKTEHKKELAAELEQTSLKLSDTQKLIDNLSRLRNELKDSNEYNELISLIELKKKSLSELDSYKNKVFHSFSVINASLKKYARITIKDTDLLNLYIEDPVEAIIGDKELGIMDLLDGTRKSIVSNGIELKDKKRDKTLQELNSLTKEFFSNFKARYSEIINKIKALKEKIKANDTKEKIEELDVKIETSTQDLNKTKSYLEYLQAELAKIDFDKIKKDLEKKILEIFNVKVLIS